MRWRRRERPGHRAGELQIGRSGRSLFYLR